MLTFKTNVGLVMNRSTHAALHKALSGCASTKTDDILFQVYLCMYMPIIISLYRSLTENCKNKTVQLFCFTVCNIYMHVYVKKVNCVWISSNAIQNSKIHYINNQRNKR